MKVPFIKKQKNKLIHMSCYITSGQALGCSDGIGGLYKLYIVGGGGAITGFTYDADGAITGGTASTGTTIYGFELKRNTSSLTQNIQKNFENGTIFFDQEVLAVFYKYDQQKRNELKILSQNDKLQIIVVDQNQVQYFVGQVNGCYLASGAATTGVQFSDRNGFSLTFKGQEHDPANVINGSLSSVFGVSVVG